MDNDSKKAKPKRRKGAGSAVTISDIARIAGVSKKSVSRALNNEEGLSPDTRKRLKEIMEEHGYFPDRRARALAASRSYLIGVAYNNRNPSFVLDILNGVQQTAGEKGYEVVMHEVGAESDRLEANIRSFMQRSGCDGLILTPPLSETYPLVGAFTEDDWPLVRIAGDDVGLATPQIRYDDRSASLAITRYVLDQGHKRLAFVGGPESSGPTRRRLAGFRDAITSRDLAVDEALITYGDFTFQSGLQAGSRLLEAKSDLTAIICANDAMAAGVIHAVRENSMRVPDNISVTGFDDSELAQQVWPPLTSVAQPVREMALEASRVLIEALSRDNEDAPSKREFAHLLSIRKSVGPPP